MYTREYRITRFSSVEGNDLQGWVVVNEVTGLVQEADGYWVKHKTFEDAKAAALFVAEYYKAVERGN